MTAGKTGKRSVRARERSASERGRRVRGEEREGGLMEVIFRNNSLIPTGSTTGGMASAQKQKRTLDMKAYSEQVGCRITVQLISPSVSLSFSLPSLPFSSYLFSSSPLPPASCLLFSLPFLSCLAAISQAGYIIHVYGKSRCAHFFPDSQQLYTDSDNYILQI